jgi:hypothetical protein
VIADNIAASISHGAFTRHAYKPIGMLAPLERKCAVAEIYGFTLSGFFAWWLWRTIYLLKLPGLERKVRVALDWTLDLFFSRDIALLKLFRRADIERAEFRVENRRHAARKRTRAVRLGPRPLRSLTSRIQRTIHCRKQEKTFCP